MNRKKTALFLGVCMAASVLFAGCGPKEIENDYVKVTGYKGLEVERVEKEKITDSSVESQVELIRDNYATYPEVTDRAVQDGDIVTIDYTGKKDGVAFEGGTAQDQQLTIGSGRFIDGFEEGIIGHKKGESFDLNLTFPKDYQSEELAGQAVVFSVNLKKIETKVLPELNDEFVTMVKGEDTTVKEYKKEIKDILKLKAESDHQALKEQQITDALLKKTEVKKYPEKELERYKKMVTDQYQQIADATESEYKEVVEQYSGMTEEDFNKQLDKQIKEIVKRQEALELIAKEEDVAVSDKEIDKWLKNYSELNQITVDELKKQNSDADIEKNVLQEKTINWLWDNAKIKENKKEK